MSRYYVSDRWGGSDDEPSIDQMREFLAELDVSDPEHPDTWLEHESGWTLTAYETGQLVLGNPDSNVEPRHLASVTRERVLELWLLLASGNLEEIERQPWQPGDGIPPMTEAERAELDASMLEYWRSVYDGFGAERSDTPCREPGCSRGAVVASVLCRTHHYESVLRQPCPFSH